MLDVNMIIANNIQAELKKENKKQVDLAEGIGVSKQTMSKIMNGARAINAIELHKISEYLHVSMDSLMKMPEKPMDTNFLSAGQCATGNGGPFVLDATVARSGSTSNADRWICDFYGPAGGRQRSCTSGTGGSNASAGMVHIRCPPRIACLWNCTKKQRPSG